MSKLVRLDDEAESELDAAVAWYESHLAGLGLELLDEANQAKARLAATPAAYSFAPDVPRELGVRRCPAHRFPYSLVYLELARHIRVLAFAHDRRRPFYWRERL